MNKRLLNNERVSLRQLCCLGYETEVIMPNCLAHLRKMLDCHSSIFIWFDDTYTPKNLFTDRYIPSTMAFFLDNYRTLLGPDTFDLERVARIGMPVGNFREMPKTFYGTDMYTMICKSCDQYFFLDGIVRDGNKALGMVLMCREKGHGSFNVSDSETLAAELPYFTHAFLNDSSAGVKNKDDDDYTECSRGLIITNTAGEICHISPSAKEILFWVSHRLFHPSTKKSDDDRLSRQIKLICRRLSHVFESKTCAPPSVRIRHAYGQTVLQAQWLDKYKENSTQYIGIDIVLQKPIDIRIAENISHLCLSPKQKDICLMLSLGKSNKDISQQLGISTETYKDYMKKIYSKLEINKRDELMSVLKSTVH